MSLDFKWYVDTTVLELSQGSDTLCLDSIFLIKKRFTSECEFKPLSTEYIPFGF